MRQNVVLDASAMLAWLFDEGENAGVVDVLIDDTLFVSPTFWLLEVVNVVTRRGRQKKLTDADIDRLLGDIDAFEIELFPDPSDRVASQFARLARTHQLTAYDATYLDLAIRRNLPLCTFDRNLRLAAERMGVALVG